MTTPRPAISYAWMNGQPGGKRHFRLTYPEENPQTLVSPLPPPLPLSPPLPALPPPLMCQPILLLHLRPLPQPSISLGTLLVLGDLVQGPAAVRLAIHDVPLAVHHQDRLGLRPND